MRNVRSRSAASEAHDAHRHASSADVVGAGAIACAARSIGARERARASIDDATDARARGSVDVSARHTRARDAIERSASPSRASESFIASIAAARRMFRRVVKAKPPTKFEIALDAVRARAAKIGLGDAFARVERDLVRSYGVYKAMLMESPEFQALRANPPGWVGRSARARALAADDDFACAFVALSPLMVLVMYWIVSAILRWLAGRDGRDMSRSVFGAARERGRKERRREAEAKAAATLPNQPPPHIDRTESGRVVAMTEKDKELLGQLRIKLNEAAASDAQLLGTPALRAFVTDACLCRYLRARKWNVDKALKMLIGTLHWRAERKPEALTWNDVAEEAKTGKQYRSGRDKRGRRVLVMRPDRENTYKHEDNIKFLIYTLENILWKSSRSNEPLGSNVDLAPEQITILINFTNWSRKNAVPMATARETLSILQNHYPERLGLAVCFNPPTIFRVFWSVISPFIDPKTYTKIVFVNKKKSERAAAVMGAVFHANAVDDDMGGAVPAAWHVDEYAKHMKEYDAKKAVVMASWL